MHIGQAAADPGAEPMESAGDRRRLVAELTAAVDAQHDQRPAVAAVLVRIAEQIEMASRDLTVDLLDEHIYALESAMLHECWLALSNEEQQTIDDRVEAAVTASTATEEARRRSERALRDREIRLLLNLPRLEIGR
ncbi:MAG: hypothetical protein E4H44_05000 [Candidatus Aminicenantes bacterium]|nr:MAG: hypothetical protein E4H44_05000 [Candidatus Aminicenantes bacterium]